MRETCLWTAGRFLNVLVPGYKERMVLAFLRAKNFLMLMTWSMLCKFIEPDVGISPHCNQACLVKMEINAEALRATTVPGILKRLKEDHKAWHDTCTGI